MAGCADSDLTDDVARGADGDAQVVGQPVLFTSGNERPATRAGVPYMARDGRFVCTMYYHTETGHTDSDPYDITPVAENGTATTAWLLVDDNVGNSVYRQKDYATPTKVDYYNFDEAATKFYWQNRLTHAFLALADYNQLKTNDGSTTAQGKLKMYPSHDTDLKAPEEGEEDTLLLANARYANKYDLTRFSIQDERQKRDENGEVILDDDSQPVMETYERPINKIAEQPDPILALTIMKPAGATQEANRVRLYFKHQFSQIQVNIKGPDDGSATIQPEQIDKVELLGVSEEGYVFTRLNSNGTVGTGDKPVGHTITVEDSEGNKSIVPDEDIMLGSAKAKEVDLDSYNTAHLEQNKWGTSFEMFDMATGIIEDGHDTGYATGYLKSFNAIAFGTLWAIRITWHELAGDHIQHVSTYEVPATNQQTSGTTTEGDEKPVVYLRNLQSNMRYVYDFELRRGTLAVIRTQIMDWMQKEELVYGADGTIYN